MKAAVGHHDDAVFYCVKCANEKCAELIRLLEYDPEKQRKNPPEFQAKCQMCGQINLYTTFRWILSQFEGWKDSFPRRDSET
jgi:hypothetical protein